VVWCLAWDGARCCPAVDAGCDRAGMGCRLARGGTETALAGPWGHHGGSTRAVPALVPGGRMRGASVARLTGGVQATAGLFGGGLGATATRRRGREPAGAEHGGGGGTLGEGVGTNR